MELLNGIIRKSLLGALLLPCMLALASDNRLELQVKAAFLYKFCNYIEWPAETFESLETPLVIAVMGDSILAEELAVAVEGRQVGNRPLQVRRVQPGDKLKNVNVLFIGGGKAAYLSKLADHPDNRHILIVTEFEGAFPQSMINFVMEDNHVRFDISQDRAEKAGLKLSSQLLSVARNVHRRNTL